MSHIRLYTHSKAYAALRSTQEYLEEMHYFQFHFKAYCQLESVSNLAAEKPSIPIWTLPVNIFVDDTSAIRSK